jgi:hypothetical protein
MKDVTDGIDSRVTNLENQIQMLKSMGKGDDGGPGVFEMLQEMRTELMKRI